MPDPIKVALLTEPGGPHLDIYMDCIAGASGVREVAVADGGGDAVERARAKIAGRLGGVRGYRDVQELLREQRPDLVIASFSGDHAPPVIAAALESGAHVIAEKPACVRAADFERLNDLAARKQRHLMLAFATRMNPLVRKARQLVSDGALGKLYGATLCFIADQTRLRSPQYQSSWYADKERAGGGNLIWLGIHYVDALQFITGQSVSRVCGFAANVGGTPLQVEDAAAVVMEFDGGMVGTLESGYYLDRGYQSQIRIWGSAGWIYADLISGAPMEWRLYRSDASEKLAPPPDAANGLYAQFIQAAVDAARGTAAPPVTGTECVRALRVVFALYDAASGGRAQRLA
jgi:predicted dehydrogenase